MRFLFLVFFLSSAALAYEITIKNNVNLRTSPSFIGSANIAGQLFKGAKVKVLEEKTLPSGNKAYRISTADIKPASAFRGAAGNGEVWVYGSSQFVQNVTAARTEAIPSEKVCADCLKAAPSVQPIREIVQYVENQGSVAGLSADAQAVIESLRTYGIPCDLRSQQIELRGVQCKGKLPGYPQPVRFYIPKDYEKNDKNKLNVFFHGFESSGDVYQINKNDRNGYGDFGARLADSGNKKTILVVPESRGQSATYLQYFKDGTGKNFEYFLNQISNATESKFASTVISGHSGGYLPIDALLSYPSVAQKVKKIGLFDGSYNQTVNITNWLNSSSENSMRLSWVKNGDVEKQTQAFISRVRAEAKLVKVPTAGSHMDNIRDGGFSNFLKDDIFI